MKATTAISPVSNVLSHPAFSPLSIWGDLSLSPQVGRIARRRVPVYAKERSAVAPSSPSLLHCAKRIPRLYREFETANHFDGRKVHELPT